MTCALSRPIALFYILKCNFQYSTQCAPLDPRGSNLLSFGNVKMKRTPLFNAHQRLGAKLIEFGGWEMPVQYTSITDEHLTVRNEAGIFDISHMGEVAVKGPGAEAFL